MSYPRAMWLRVLDLDSLCQGSPSLVMSSFEHTGVEHALRHAERSLKPMRDLAPEVNSLPHRLKLGH